MPYVKFVEQVVAAVDELGACEAAIHSAEHGINEMVFALYKLTKPEPELVQGS